MPFEFKLPDVGEGIAEGEIVKWLVSAGDAVEEHQSVVEVMTDKATVEVPAPKAGRIVELRAKEGDVVPVGQVLFVLDAAGAEETPTAAPPAAPPAAGPILEFQLPDVGEGIAEGEIVRWLVEEGDAVAEHQSVVEVMTDKATVEIPAPAPGRLAKRLVQPGEVVPIGAVLFHLERSGSEAIVPSPGPPAPTAPASAPGPAAAAPVSAATATLARPGGNGKVRAVPSARRIARELGIDLTLVLGTGRNGVIRRMDVETFAQTPQTVPAPAAAPPQAAAPPAPVPAGERETRTPFLGLRRRIAEAMARSKLTAAHFSLVEEIDVTDLVTLRNEAKSIGAEQGIKVTYMPFIMKAVANGLLRYPQLNCRLDEATQELVTFHYVNLGIAMDTDRGLIVPVIPDVQSKGLLQLASELGELAERTRSGGVRSEDLQGGTFTITNAGNIGGVLSTPIINYPECAILGAHRIVKRPGVVETQEGDRIEVRHYLNLSISVDHRLADGADAARFLAHIRKLLEHPGLLSL